jgi:hypothetical protein
MLQQAVGNAQESYSYIKDVLLAVAAIASVIVSFIAALLVRDFNKRTLKQKQQEEERKAIHEKLNSFYGPLQRLRGKSKMLADIFKNAEYFNGKTGDERRTLVVLLKGHEFVGNDLQLLEEIIRIGRKSEILIMQKSGLVDDERVRKILDKAATHYTLIRLAKQKKLNQDVERFKEYVFPEEIDGILENEIKNLNMRLHILNTEIERNLFSQKWADFSRRLKRIEADERSLDLRQSDNTVGSVWTDIGRAHRLIEDAQEHLNLSRQAENYIKSASVIIDNAERRLEKLSKRTEGN